MIEGYLKNKYRYLNINEIFLVRKKGHCFKKMVMVESYFFLGAGAGVLEKNTRSRSNMDRLRNTDCKETETSTMVHILPPRLLATCRETIFDIFSCKGVGIGNTGIQSKI